jgi:hypothetical protein
MSTDEAIGIGLALVAAIALIVGALAIGWALS